MTLTGGSNYTCLWNFGDGTATNTSDPVSTPVGTTSYLHTFPAPNVYIVNVTCTNLVSALSVSLVQRVQERITGLRLTREGQDTMLDVIVPWTLATGSHVTWVCLLDGVAMGVDSAASNVPLKLWQSVSMGKKPGGAKIVNITASNEVSNLTLSTTYLLVTKIVGPRATASTNKTTTGNDIIYTVGVSAGSDVVVIVNYNDGSVDNKTYSGDQGFSDTFKHNFFNGGLYVVNVSNAFDVSCSFFLALHSSSLFFASTSQEQRLSTHTGLAFSLTHTHNLYTQFKVNVFVASPVLCIFDF